MHKFLNYFIKYGQQGYWAVVIHVLGRPPFMYWNMGGYHFRILTHWVPTLLSVYPEVLTPPPQIGTQQFLEKRDTHTQIGIYPASNT